MVDFVIFLAVLSFVYALTIGCFGEDVFGQKNKILTLLLFQEQGNSFIELKDFQKIDRDNRKNKTLHGSNNDVLRLYYTRRILLNVSRGIVTLLGVLMMILTVALIMSQQKNLFVLMFSSGEKVPSEAYGFAIVFVAFVILSVWTVANRLNVKGEFEKLSYTPPPPPPPPTPAPASTLKKMRNLLATFVEFLRRLDPQ